MRIRNAIPDLPVGYGEDDYLLGQAKLTSEINLQSEVRSKMAAKKKIAAVLKESASWPALQMSQNSQKFYFVSIPVDDLFPYCYVASRFEDPKDGFQRTLSEDRADDIADYLDRGTGSIPTNIVLSAQSNSEFEYSRLSKSIKYKRTPKAFLVLDGQHRLYGYSRAKKPLRVPVAIYEGLTRAEEATLFIDINTNQKGVPAALLLDIKQVAQQENDHEIQLREIFDLLSREDGSPFKGYLSPSKSVTGKISRVTFNRGLTEILKNDVVSKLSRAKQYQLVRNYFTALQEAIKNKGLLYKSVYFEAFCDFFEHALRVSREKNGNYKAESLKRAVSPLGSVAIEDILISSTKLTKAAILKVLKSSVIGSQDVSDDMV